MDCWVGALSSWTGVIQSTVLEYCRGLFCVPWGLSSPEVLCVSETCLMAPALGRACPCHQAGGPVLLAWGVPPCSALSTTPLPGFLSNGGANSPTASIVRLGRHLQTNGPLSLQLRSWFLWPDLLGSLLPKQWPLGMLWRNAVDWG